MGRGQHVGSRKIQPKLEAAKAREHELKLYNYDQATVGKYPVSCLLLAQTVIEAFWKALTVETWLFLCISISCAFTVLVIAMTIIMFCLLMNNLHDSFRFKKLCQWCLQGS